MSSVITIAPPLLQQQVLHIPLPAMRGIGSALQELFYKIKSSNLFSMAQMEEINAIEAKLKNCDNEMQNKEQQEEFSLTLCILLAEFIYPTVAQTSEAEQHILLSLEDEFMTLLKQTLPLGEDIKKFIANAMELSDEGALLQKNAEAITHHFQQQIMQSTCALANETSRELQSRFQQLKERLLAVNSRQSNMTDEMNAHLDSLTRRVEQASQILFARAQETQVVGKKMEEQQHAFQQILQECQDVLEGI